ncbi:hypothetical protein [Streptomyces sp. AC627_RSS907]|uniref:hypothetical protein n=1 Tax=Streptomyces sp. AC627_RSS907 TaxID=2823684 RepID=UPI001C229AAE|nr:hypothetical protein [Streptomyces sp. AC627_RSS907]
MLTALFDRVGHPVVACLAAGGIAAAVLIGKDGLDTVVGCGTTDDAYPSQTAKDWVTQADHVVVATPTAEQESNRRNFSEGPIEYATDRSVTFRTDDVLWSAKSPRHSLGDTFGMEAAGWKVRRESGTRTKATTASAPRLETGHTYLLALRWAGDRWITLGEGAAVPFDDRTVARGEWCGRVLSEDDVAAGEHFSRIDDKSLEKRLVGQDEQAVKRELDGATAKTGR